MPLALDLQAYAAEAETFVGSMDREYYLHFAGHKRELEISPIYDRHHRLFEKAASAFMVSACSRSMISFGVFAGANSAV